MILFQFLRLDVFNLNVLFHAFLWNNLPVHMKSVSNLNAFKLVLKDYVLSDL